MIIVHDTLDSGWFDAGLRKSYPHAFEGMVEGDYGWNRTNHEPPKIELLDSEVFQPVKDWLMEQDREWLLDNVDGDGISTFFHLYIQDANTAMMFKLAWCGV